jgi:hypothetical protein
MGSMAVVVAGGFVEAIPKFIKKPAGYKAAPAQASGRAERNLTIWRNQG